MNQGYPILSVCVRSYNQKDYLRIAVESILSQRTDFDFEIIISDDCSTDNSATIIREYTEKYPELFIPIFETENQYPKHDGSIERIMKKTIDATRCRYVAFCEGDDYWTDPYKLQKQVDFMEVHPEYSVTFHRCKHLNFDTGVIQEDHCGELFKNGENGVDIDEDMFFSNWYTQPLSIVYRAECWILEEMLQYRYYRDMHEIYHLLKHGKGYIFSFFGGIRTKHSGGVSSLISDKQYCDTSLPIDREFYWKTRDKGPKRNYIDTLDKCVEVYSKTNLLKAFRCAVIRLFISGHPRGFVRQMKLIFCK